MHIGLIVDPYGEKSPGGLGRAIFEMAKGIVEFDRHRVYTLYFKKLPERPPNIAGEHWHMEAIGETYLLVSGARKISRALDLYIFFNPIIPLFFFPKKSIVVVHDFAYLEMPSHSFKQKLISFVLYAAHGLSLWKATKIVAVSQTAKDSVVRHFHISPEKIQVIYNGFIAPAGVSEPLETPEQFFLFAGVLKERKNVLGVVRAFALFAKSNSDYALLIAGKKEGGYYAQVAALVQELGVEDRVRFLGYVTDGQLAYLYTKAKALVFPSLIEGFGMPVLEAMSVGLPVITSNTGALAEVAGDAAVLVDPYDPEAIARGMTQVASSVERRAPLIEKGTARAEQFSWKKNARAFQQIIITIVT